MSVKLNSAKLFTKLNVIWVTIKLLNISDVGKCIPIDDIHWYTL